MKRICINNGKDIKYSKDEKIFSFAKIKDIKTPKADEQKPTANTSINKIFLLYILSLSFIA